MTHKLSYLGLGLLGVIALMFLTACFVYLSPRFAGAQVSAPKTCTASSTTAVPVGHQASTQISAAAGGLAVMRVQQPINATNTVTIALNGGTAATVGNGLQLTPATTTSPVPFVLFGLATDYPYTGAVTAISNNGSTTVLVNRCIY